MYDIIIIGGGIAGLSTALYYSKKYKILILEKYPNLGGRITTNKDPQYEIGAGRIHKSHTRIKSLIEKYGLTKYPITPDSYFETQPNSFQQLFYPIIELLSKLPEKELKTHTIRELLPSCMYPILEQYPYRAEVELLRADIALHTFKPKKEMGDMSQNAFYGIQEGLGKIIEYLAKEVKESGVEIRTRYRVEDILYSDNMYEVVGDYGKRMDKKPFRFSVQKVIIATCRCSLSKFSVLNQLPLLKQLQTSALCRIYAIFPKKQGRVWFSDISKTVTTNPLRFIIPINKDSGLIMISYTDGRDTDFWKDLEEESLENEIMLQTRKCFPDYDIPAPTYLKKHYWPSGCTYWTPGEYDVEEAQLKAMFPKKNLFIVGESVSKSQAWIESALESVELFTKNAIL